MLHNTTMKIPQDRSPGEEHEIEKTPLHPDTYPLLLQGEINEGKEGEGGRRREEEEDKDEGWSKMKDESQGADLTGSSVIRSETKLIYTSVKCTDGKKMMNY